jgi:HTH-type transcriptional regulator, quorum sensing regulator NprR
MEDLNQFIQKENLKILGSIIKINRINQNMSQQALSEGICVPSYLSKIENGEVLPSLEMIRLIFQELCIEYNDDNDFVNEMKGQLILFFEELNLNGFITSKEIFKFLEQHEHQLIHSPLIIDYYIAKLAFYCGTNEQALFLHAKKTIQHVEGLLSGLQKHRYYFYEALNLFIKEKNFHRAKEKLMLAKEIMETGHLYYFLAIMEYKLSSYYGAVIYAEKALQFYLEEVNIINVSLTHQFQGLLVYQLGTKELYESYFEKAITYAQKIKRNDILLSTLTLYLYIQFKEGKANSNELFVQIKLLQESANTISDQDDLIMILGFLFEKKFNEESYSEEHKIKNRFYKGLLKVYQSIETTNFLSKESFEEMKAIYELEGHPNLLNDLIMEDLWIYYIESNRFYKQAYLKIKDKRI